MAHIALAAYFLLLSVALGATLFQWKRLAKADKWISFLLVLTLLDETVARYLTVRYHNDLITFHVYSPLELMVICCYFNESVPFIRHKNKGLWLAAAGLVCSLTISTFFQHIDSLNSSFLFFESVCIISLALAAYADIALSHSARPLRSVQFWIVSALLIYWTFAAVHWAMFLMIRHVGLANTVTLYALWIFNLVFYGVLACVFIAYHKMIPSGANK